MPSRPFSDCSTTSMPGGDVVGDQRRHADAEVDVEAVAQLLGGAHGDLLAGELLMPSPWASTVRCSMGFS